METCLRALVRAVAMVAYHKGLAGTTVDEKAADALARLAADHFRPDLDVRDSDELSDAELAVAELASALAKEHAGKLDRVAALAFAEGLQGPEWGKHFDGRRDAVAAAVRAGTRNEHVPAPYYNDDSLVELSCAANPRY